VHLLSHALKSAKQFALHVEVFKYPLKNETRELIDFADKLIVATKAGADLKCDSGLYLEFKKALGKAELTYNHLREQSKTLYIEIVHVKSRVDDNIDLPAKGSLITLEGLSNLANKYDIMVKEEGGESVPHGVV